MHLKTKKGIVLIFILFVISSEGKLRFKQANLVNATQKNMDPVIIYSISTRIHDRATSQGSLEGGTKLYMKVSGLDQHVSNNAVYIGRYPCIIPENEVNQLLLICETTKPNPLDTQLMNLPIVIKVAGKSDSICTLDFYYCFYSYVASFTPILNYVSPSSSYPGQMNFWQVSNTYYYFNSDYIEGFYIGQHRCSEVTPTSGCNGGVGDAFFCQVSTDIEAGTYSFLIKILDGNSKKHTIPLQKNADDGNIYEAKIMPLITSLNSNKISSEGAEIIVNGFGFSQTISNNVVNISGYSGEVKVINSTPKQLTIQISPLKGSNEAIILSGSGLKYTRYDLSGTDFVQQSSDFRNELHTNSSQFQSKILFEGCIYIGSDIFTTSNTFIGEYLRGFIKVPKTGNYKFYVTSIACAEVYIKLDPIQEFTKVAYSCWGFYRNYRYYSLNQPTTETHSISEAIAMNQDEYYQIEIIHTSYIGNGYFIISLEMESDIKEINSICDLYAITRSWDPFKEVIEILVYNSADNTPLIGTYKLYFELSTFTTSEIYANATEQQMSSAISRYSLSVVREKVDKSGAVLDSSAERYAGWKYSITFQQYRPSYDRCLPTVVQSTLIAGTVKISIQTTQEPTDPFISGTFQLAVEYSEQDDDVFYYLSNSLKIFDLTYSDHERIADNLERITNFRPIINFHSTRLLPTYQDIIYIQLRGVQSLTLKVVKNNFICGPKCTPKIQIETIHHSNNILFEPIPSEFLFRSFTVPQLQVTVNGILGGCEKDGVCDITIDDQPRVISGFTRNEAQLNITFQSDLPQTLLDQGLLTVKFAGAQCSNIRLANVSTITCKLITLKGQVVLEAGNQLPKVHQDGFGFFKIDASVTAEVIQLKITSISPNTGSPDGFTTIVINGTGFPLDQTRFTELTIGGTSVTPVSVSNTQIVVITPPRVGSLNKVDIVINYNGKSVTSTLFSYYDSFRMEITNLEFTKKGPTFKGTITITGTNFGTDKSKLTVNLKNQNKNYECPVLSVTDTQIVVYLRGGMPGVYQFQVIMQGVGRAFSQSNANQFSYITPIENVTTADGSEAVGSEAGGTRLKIVGENFVPEETIVLIGPKENNQICILDEPASSTSTLYCTTPPKHVSYKGPQEVVITTRVSLESVCDTMANCNFEFQSALTPSLVSYPAGFLPITGARLLSEQNHVKSDYQKTVTRKRLLWTEESKKIGQNQIYNLGKSQRRDLLSAEELVFTQFKIYLSGDNETLTATGATGPIKIIFRGITTIEVDASLDSDQGTIAYLIPNLVQGDYATYILTATGYADKIWITRISLTVLSVTPQNAVPGGQVIEINGGGFNANADIAVKINSILCTHLHVISTVQLECRTPRTTVTGSNSLVISQIDLSNFSLQTITSQTNVNVLAVSGTPQATTLSGNSNLSYQTTLNSYVLVGDSRSFQFTIIGSALEGTTAKVFIEYNNKSYEGFIITKSETQAVVQFTNIPMGTYLIQYSIDNKFVFFSNLNYQNLLVQGSVPISSNPYTSYAGGKTITFTGIGFDTDTTYSKVSVCGFDCPITSANFTTLNCEAPVLPSPSVLGQYTSLQESPRYISPSEITITSDSGTSNAAKLFDQQQTTYYDSTAIDCYVIIDLGSDRELKLQQFRYAPRIDVLANYLKDAVFQYSTDGTTFTNLFVIDQTVHSGWNIYVPTSLIEHIKKIKFTDSRGTSGSQCQLAEIEIKGWIISSVRNLYSEITTCKAEVAVNGFKLPTIYPAVTYSSASTPTVTTVTPTNGQVTEETEITITGTGLDQILSTEITITRTGFVQQMIWKRSTTVMIDGITCVVSIVSATQIVCTTGTKDTSINQKNGDFQVRVDGNLSVNNQIFKYANRWSNIATWGGYAFPSDGDSVIVNKGETLIVDQITPKLMQIFIEGELTFADEGPTSLDAHYILVNEGKFTIGTETVPHLNQVNITLRGVEEDTQFPYFGNKVLGCHQCTLDIHGKVRTPTWTLLSSPVEVGATSITVDDPIDWVIGESIVITSSEIDHLQSEVRIIVSVTGQTITLDQPLKFKHYSAVEIYGTDSFSMKVEVGLLTRNIVIQGEQSDKNYGGHLMIHGLSRFGEIGRISYTEFKQVGQQTIQGRYPIYFNLNGAVQESFIKGNSIHDSYSRCIAFRGVQYLKVQKNVCYDISGHAIFLEDGTETNNIIEDNLVVTVKFNWFMLQSDLTCAAYWITNPQNIVRRNRSGGSEWQGFAYELKTTFKEQLNICPSGLNIIEFTDNWSHSNGRYGLRISDLAPRQYPCLAYRDNSKEDPFKENPSLQAVFQRFWTWKNDECGILGELLGNVLFKNMMIADSKVSGLQAHEAKYSREGITLQDTIIIGKSNGNAAAQQYYDGSRGIIVPRTNGFLAKNIKLFNFGANQILIESCSLCWNYKFSVNGGKNSHFLNIQILNSDLAKRIYWQENRREIFWDLDGSLTGTGTPSYIIPFKQHITGITGCTDYPEDKWDNSIVCDMNQVEVRDILIHNPMNYEYLYFWEEIKLFRLSSNVVNQKIDESTSNLYFQSEKLTNSQEYVNSYAGPFVTGQTYNVHLPAALYFYDQQHDFDQVGFFPSPYFKPEDKGIVLRFNYSENRTFQIYRRIGYSDLLIDDQILTIPNPASCDNGQWFNNQTEKLFFLCLSGRNKTELEYMSIRSIFCGDYCDPIGTPLIDDQIHLWSDPKTWIDEKVPVEGDSPTIQGTYQVLLDIDPPLLQDLTILGQLIFDDTRAISTLRAHKIWVKTGNIIAGNFANPFPGKINIILEGNLDEDSLVIDNKIDAGSKVLAVTNGLELYGINPKTVWTRLAAYGDAGATQVTVIECTGWQVGDEIVFGPSGSDPEQREKRTITAITETTITLNSALVYDHYGAPDITITKDGIGNLDMRAAVGHLTRNIKIIGRANEQGLGCRVLIYQSDVIQSLRGYAVLHGVEFFNCGRFDTTKSGLDFKAYGYSPIEIHSEVIGCSFHDSTGIQLTISEFQYVTVENNVFFNGQKALVQINNCQFVKFKNNLMIYVTKRQFSSGGAENWAVFGNFIYNDDTPLTIATLEVSNNVGQGSQDTGFFFMGTPCNMASQTSFFDNQCSSTILACYGITQSKDSQCNYFKGFHAYHSAVGIVATMNTEETRADGLILIENGRGLVLKPATVSIQNNVMQVTNSYIAAVARLDCPKCYKKSLQPYCQDTFGFQLGTISSSAFPPISDKPSTAYDIICTVQRVDCRVYINNVVFENYKMNYTEIPECGQNGVFRQHSEAHDMTGQHYLTNSPCINCHFESRVKKLLNPSEDKLGWYGGCGSFVCTGQINILIEDQDGKFFGEIGQAIGNNTYFGPNVTYCRRQEEWNGYWCLGKHATILNFMSTAPDFNKRLYSPVQLTDGEFFNLVNSYSEWSWNGSEPKNQRESKFVSLVSVNTTINMTNAGVNPTSSEYWLSKRSLSGSPEDWVIIKLQFIQPQIVQIKVDNEIVQPGMTKTNNHYDLSEMTNICGANNYFYDTRTIHFVVTGQLGCKVSLYLKNTLQITTRLTLASVDFLGDRFLKYAVAQLGGDPYNYFILDTIKRSRRLLQENYDLQEVTVIWGIIDSADIGTKEGESSAAKLEVISTNLQYFKPTEVGEIIQNTVQVQVIETLNYPSTEATGPSESSEFTEQSETTETTESSGESGYTKQPSSNEANSSSNTNNDNSVPPKNLDNSVSYIPKNSEDKSPNVTNTTNDIRSNEEQAAEIKQNNLDKSTIIVSVIVSTVIVSIFILGWIYCSRVKNQKLVPVPNYVEDKVSNEIVNQCENDTVFEEKQELKI